MISKLFLYPRRQGSKSTVLMARYYCGNQRMVISTGINLDPNTWNPSPQHATEKGNSKGREINEKVHKFITGFEGIIHHLQYENRKVTPRAIISELKAEKIRSNPENNSILSYMEAFIEAIRNGDAITITGRKYRLNTIKNYVKTYNHLVTFSRGNLFTWADINMDFYNAFLTYCNKHNYSINHTGSMVKCIKAICRRAQADGINTTTGWMAPGFRTITEDTNPVYLSIDELSMIIEADFGGRHAELRDLFIVASFTGLRYSDLVRLSPENIHGNIIEIEQEKTRSPVSIPINNVVQTILKRYNYRLPSLISNQKYNKALKEICEKAKINSPEVITITRGGERKEITGKKWEFVSTHTARRSFATNAYLAGVPAYSIMQITGHRTEKAFLRYLRITSKQNAMKMASHPFFR